MTLVFMRFFLSQLSWSQNIPDDSFGAEVTEIGRTFNGEVKKMLEATTKVRDTWPLVNLKRHLKVENPRQNGFWTTIFFFRWNINNF